MSALEALFYMMWRGLAIGVIISAPMGPVGILCIQRTLDKGRKAGFYTGVGAAISDLFYCLLTGFGLSFIEEFLEENSSVIQLAGSAVLIAFGIYLFRKKNAGQFRHAMPPQNISAQKNVLAGFLFTFSNPLILFLIIGLFARFNFLMPEIQFYHYMVGYIFIFAGALGWWWLVTFSIDKVRAHFNLGSMIIINRVIGSVILLFAIVGIVGSVMDLMGGSKANAREIYLNPRRGFGQLESSDTLQIGASDADFSITAKVTSAKKQPWGMWIGKEGRGVRFDFCNAEATDGITSHPAVRITATDADGHLLATAEGDIGKDLTYGQNCWQIKRKGNEITLLGGHHGLKEMIKTEAPDMMYIEELSFIKPARKNLFTLHEAIVEIYEDGKASTLNPWGDSELLSEYLERSEDPKEGYWMVLDRSLEETLLRMGGEYKLAMVKAFDGYDLIYIDGARTSASQWRAGMRKAHLSQSGISNVWNVVWIDSEGKEIKNSVKGQFDASDILTIQFPYQNSSIRLSRVND